MMDLSRMKLTMFMLIDLQVMFRRGVARYALTEIPERFLNIYEKHGGETTESNLCLSCFECNRHKGSDICSLDPLTGDIAPLFHPRHEQWMDHFTLGGAVIRPLTPQARIAVRLLRLNDDKRIFERNALIDEGRYP
jgi:HNH endonuclease